MARVVFGALEMLTDTVILFDEFDSVLRRREPGTKIKNIYEFLTPGMLPKLKALNNAAKRRRVVYMLATNLVGDLDEAAIRSGRFDAKVGLYPPDLLSRTGQLVAQASRIRPLTRKALDRVAQIVKVTASGGMTQLTKEGWLVAPRKKRALEGTPLNFIHENRGKAPSPLEPEKKRPEKRELKNSTPDSDREWHEWTLVDDWDIQLFEDATWSDLLATIKKAPRWDRIVNQPS
jgi:hypothetical protein